MMYCTLLVVSAIGLALGDYVINDDVTNWGGNDGGATGNKVIFCYYSSSAQTRASIGRFLPEHVNPALCTHILFAFVNIVNGRDLEPANWNDYGLYDRTLALKQKQPSLKVLLSLGGWVAGSDPFMPMVANASNRRAFVRNVVRFLREHGFDGLDMDWEFPGARGSPEDDKYRFTTLLRELQTAFRREATRTGQERLLLTLATAGGSYFINKAYETDKIHPFLDYMLLMAYNYHGSWNNFTGHHSGLYPRTDEIGGMRELNQQWTLDYWRSQGVPKSKLVVGISMYGMSFTLADPTQHGLGAPTLGGGEPGKYTQESGILSYYEICEKLKGPWNYVWVEEQKAPYAHYRNQWVGFDDVNSARYKAEYILHNGYAGAFVWSVEMDDFRGTCGEGGYPLLNTIANILRPYSDANAYQRNAPSQPRLAAQPPRAPTLANTIHIQPRVHIPDQRLAPPGGTTRQLEQAQTPLLTASNPNGMAHYGPEYRRPSVTSVSSLSPVNNRLPSNQLVNSRFSSNRLPSSRAYGDGGINYKENTYGYGPVNNNNDIYSRSSSKVGYQYRTVGNANGYTHPNSTDAVQRRIQPTRQQGRYVDSPSPLRTKATPTQIIRTNKVTSFRCETPGIHRDADSCDGYFVCIMAGHQWKLYRMKCPQGLGYDDTSKACLINAHC